MDPVAQPIKLLLAEDDLSLADIYGTRFEAEGFTLTHAADGEAALNAIRQDHPDLVLLDLMMPKMSGFEVLEAVKKDPEIKDTKIVVLSALGEEEAVDKAMALGAMGYLVKAEVPLADLVADVRKYAAADASQTNV